MRQRLAQSVLDVLSFSRPGRGVEQPIGGVDEKFWEHGLRWLDEGGLALYFWRRVQAAGIQDALPASIRSALERRHKENKARTCAIVEEWKQIQNFLDSGGVRAVMLKGFSLAPDYCPDPSWRVQFDHDCLVTRESVPLVEELFERAGYCRRGADGAGQIVFLAQPVRPGSREPRDFYRATLPRPVELHLDLWDSDREGAPLKLPGDLLARSTTRAWGAASFNALGDEDAFLFEAVHAFRHVVHNWCRLSTLYEISYFLNGRRSDRDFWHRFCARIENNLPLRHVAGVVFNLASSLFKVPDPLTNVPSRLFDLTPQLQLWIDHHGMGSAIDNFSGNKLSLLLLREFVADPARWSEIRGRRLFPLQMPHRLQIPAPKRGHPFLREVCLYGSGVARRFWFHARAAAQYALESVRWHVSLRRGFGHTPPREPKAPSGESERPQARRHALRLSSRKHFYPTRDPGAN